MAKIADPQTRPTLRTLAEVTGLGVSTVSQALRDNPEIAEETRRRVKLAAQQAGYRPNRAGVRLRTGKTNVITLILNSDGPSLSLTEQMVYGVSDVLKGTPYHLVVTPYDLSDPMAPVHYVVENRLADGVIISRTQADDPRVRYLVDNNMPFATHGRTRCGIDHPFHDYDNEGFANLAVAALAKRGRKRIVHLIPPPGLLFHTHAITGFANALRKFGLSEFLANNLNIDTNSEEVRRFGIDVAQLNGAPDGYVSYSELSTMAIISGLEAAGKTLGRDFDIVTKQCSPFMSWFRPGLMMINEDHKLAGRELAKAVLGAIKGENVASLQSVAAPLGVIE